MDKTRSRRGGVVHAVGVGLAGLILSSLVGLAEPAHGQSPTPTPTPIEDEVSPAVEEESGDAGPKLDWGIEAKAHFRDSDLNRFPVNFPFAPQQLPPGADPGV